ncbi:FAD-dependent oxidoreductase [Actinomadura macrotermitis]|uniref:Ferredoxin--NADP reductase n=1 Tax=Actinomadura macrotermitis TaxID=2585200 RepID=A0A7K0BR83_9ACTN|nr:FAD-dependent oxidoreductase [Actinomadura macrotermitis]MQY03679.1 Ferredoxin--NADP reductase [Actinomadura macrotermitis]
MYDSALDVLVVGAGPYGLSVGAYLENLGVDYRIIGTPMDFWENNMPAGMLLKSEPFASSLGSPVPGLRFTDHVPGARTGQPVALPDFVAYGRWFARQAGLRPEPTEVVRLERGGLGYTATLATGETVHARGVVVAVGVGAFARSPAELGALPAGLASHSSDHRDLGVFAGRRVAVIGAGQSALETAVLLADNGAEPVLVARTRRLAWNAVPDEVAGGRRPLPRAPQSGLGRGFRTWVWSEQPWATRLLPDRSRQHIVRNTLGPAGSWWLRDRLDERVQVMLGRRVTAAAERDGQAVLTTRHPAGGEEVVADHVIAATGFACDLDRLAFLGPELRGRIVTRHGAPVLSKHFEASLPGLYFVGLAAAPSFGPVMRFVHGANFAAGRVACHVGRHAVGRRLDGATRAPAAAEV